MKARKISTKVLLFILMFSLLIPAHSFEASTADDSTLEQDVEKMRENYKILGINEEVGEKLIQKVLNGEILDSHNPDKTPINENEITVDIGEEKYLEFEDGSKIMISVEEPEPLYSTFGASTGTVYKNACKAGSGYRTCTVTARYFDFIWDLRFDTTVTTANNGIVTMSKARNYRADLVLYNYKHKNIKVTRAKSTSKLPARSQWEANFSHKAGLYSIDRTLALYSDKKSTYARLEWK